MKICINGTATELPDEATVAHAITQLAPVPPFAVAVNLHFVPPSSYASERLHEGDQIEIIAPVTGG